MGARVYDPYTGTFLQPDPIPGADANNYGYTDGDPANETDLAGKEVTCAQWGMMDGKAAEQRCVRLNTANLEKVGVNVSLPSIGRALTSGTVGKAVLAMGVVAGCLAPVSDAVCVAGLVGAGVAQGAADGPNTQFGHALGNTGAAFGAAEGCLDVDDVRMAIGCGAALYTAGGALRATVSAQH
jgi:hypothetical protein